MQADLFGNKVKRKDTKVSKHYVVTENNMKIIIKKRKKYKTFMGIEPTDQSGYDYCESSVLTTMLERMLLFTASYDKYILNTH